MRVPSVAVLGRQNVGKSTLVNRLFGRREAIADATPGVTRDRIEVEAAWRGKRFGLVDTAGYTTTASALEMLGAEQADRASGRADLILLVVDAHTGITEEDARLARRLRRAAVPVLVVANKVDTEREEPDAAVFHSLGLGEPFPISALSGRAAGDLLDRIVEIIPDSPGDEGGSIEPRFALVGRPNVGKSSLFNLLVGEERSVVYEEAGTTRDSVDALVVWPDGPVRFVDTAGMRRAVKTSGVEYYSLLRASRAIEAADVVALVVDASDGFTAEDKRIAARVIDEGRALLVVANKWDLVEEKDAIYKQLSSLIRPFARASVARASALRGQGVHRLPGRLIDLHARWNLRVPTAKVNETIHLAQAETPAPRATGRTRYATQISSGPPTFVLFGGAEPDAGYRRYLEGRLRAAFGFDGVPIRLTFRRRRGKRSTAH